MSSKLLAVCLRPSSRPAEAKKYAPSQIPPTALPAFLKSCRIVASCWESSAGRVRHEPSAPTTMTASAVEGISEIVISGSTRNPPIEVFTFRSTDAHRTVYPPMMLCSPAASRAGSQSANLSRMTTASVFMGTPCNLSALVPIPYGKPRRRADGSARPSFNTSKMCKI